MERRREAVRVAAEQCWSEAAMERWSTGAAAAVADQRRRRCGGSEQRQRCQIRPMKLSTHLLRPWVRDGRLRRLLASVRDVTESKFFPKRSSGDQWYPSRRERREESRDSVKKRDWAGDWAVSRRRDGRCGERWRRRYLSGAKRLI
ncbi:hypothetical protein U1Q18_037090 [Sarracenia purpurea var. burkii]